MPRPKGGAADEAAAEATAAAIAKELRGKFDSEVVRKEALKMYKTFSGVLDAEAVSKKIMAKREAKRAKNGKSPLLPILYSYVCPYSPLPSPLSHRHHHHYHRFHYALCPSDRIAARPPFLIFIIIPNYVLIILWYYVIYVKGLMLLIY